MTGTQLAAKIRAATKQTSAQLTDALLLPYVNNAKNELAGRIAKATPQYFVIPETFNLVTSSLTAREYPWNDNVLSRMVALQIATTTASPLDYVYCRPYPGGMQELLKQLGGLTEELITANFTNTNPYYIKTRRGVYILSDTLSAVTDGGMIWFQEYPADLATSDFSGTTDLSIDPSTTTFGMPKAFHELWCDLASIRWKGDHPGAVPLSAMEQNFEANVARELGFLSDDDRADLPVMPISDNFNHGADL